MTESVAEETLDSILGGALRLYQPRRGYRFSVEAVLLARFAAARPAARVLELGAGCGVVALIYAAAAARHARHGGRAAFIFAAARSAELISALRARRLEPKRIRFVHPYAAASASTVLVEARKGGGVEVEVEPPLVLFVNPGVYT